MKEIRSYLSYWQKSLRLTDWKIYSEIVYDGDDYGETTIKPMECSAFMKFNHPDCLDEERTAVKDIEVTVVHELLHLRFFHCTPHSGKFNSHVEQAVETTAIAMVAAKRGVSIKEIV